MKKKCLFLVIFGIICVSGAHAQGKVAVKTNLLYGIGTLTPNIGAEFGLGQRSTLDVIAGFNPWNLDGSETDNRKLAHWIVQPEYRYWLCERFNGHFFGAHAFYGMYNISGHNIPPLFGKGSDEFRFKGDIVGLGVSYGYQWMISKVFNLEFNVGVGYARLNYDKYECPRCGDKLETGVNRNYFGPTKAGVTLVFLIK